MLCRAVPIAGASSRRRADVLVALETTHDTLDGGLCDGNVVGSSRHVSRREGKTQSPLSRVSVEMVVCKAERAFPPDLESTRMWEASLEKPPPARAAKQPEPPGLGICQCGIQVRLGSFRLQVPMLRLGFPCARPRMCRLEVWVAALNLIEAHSHTLSGF